MARVDDTRGLILATVLLASAVSFVNQASGRKPVSYRSYLGASFMGIFLVIIGMVDEKLARNFAILIILSILLRDKGNLFLFAENAGKEPKQKGKHSG